MSRKKTQKSVGSSEVALTCIHVDTATEKVCGDPRIGGTLYCKKHKIGGGGSGGGSGGGDGFEFGGRGKIRGNIYTIR